MAISFVGIFVLGLLLLLLVGGIAGIVTLLANERTRAIGSGLVFGVLLAFIVAVVLGAMWTSVRVQRRVAWHSGERSPRAGVGVSAPHELPMPRVPSEAQPTRRNTEAAETVAADETSPASEGHGAEAAPAVLAEAPASDAETTASDAVTDKPAWVDDEPRFLGEVYLHPVAVGPCQSKFECERRVDPALGEAVEQYAAQLLGGNARRVRPSLGYIHDHLVAARWTEEVETSFGVPMTRLHYLLRFDNAANEEIRAAQRQAKAHDRLWLLGTGLLAVLGLLTTGFAYLKTDLATAGAMRGRLRLASGAVAAVLVAALLLLARMQL